MVPWRRRPGMNWIALARRLREPQNVAALLGWATVVVPLFALAAPWLDVAGTFGIYDWDVETSHRYLTAVSLTRYGEAPFWNPYACGGFPAWGFIEGGTNLVSPWLPAYLLLPMSLAIRVEAIGSGLLGAAGAFMAAGRFTRSHAGRALVVALWAVNGRWALQAAAGHTWHLLYAWMPWCLYVFEGGREAPTRAQAKHVVALAAIFALVLYGGGIYPLPHIVLAMGLYAAALSVADKSWAPLRLLGVAGAIGVLLAAPKLLPMLHELARSPRLIDSTEVTSARVLWLALAGDEQPLRAAPSGLSGPLPYGWHEYGIYVSAAGLAALLFFAAMARGRREAIVAGIGALFVVLGFGAFGAFAPWTLLHRLPLFASQHVPSRFFYPALLLLGCVAASGLGRVVARAKGLSGAKARWVDAGAAALVLGLALHIAFVGRDAMAESMVFPLPPVPHDETFHHARLPPYHYKVMDPALPMYPAMLGNRGVLRCYGAPPTDRIGALAVKDPEYRGEAEIIGDDGARETTGESAARSEDGRRPDNPIDERVAVAEWSPNRAVVEVRETVAHAALVYNMNYDDGWTSDYGPVIDVAGRVGVRLSGSPPPRITFVYKPRLLGAGLVLGAVGILAVALCGVFAWKGSLRGKNHL